MKEFIKKYTEGCLGQYVTANRQTGWVKKVATLRDLIKDDAYDIGDVINHCAISFDIDEWADKDSIKEAMEKSNVKIMRSLVDRTMWFYASHYIDKINRKFTNRNTYNETQLSTDDCEFNIEDYAVCYDIDDYETYEKTELYKNVIAPILDDLNLRTSTREKFVCWLFARADDLDKPNFAVEKEIGVNYRTIQKITEAIKNDKRTVNIMKNHGLMDVEELAKQNEWSVEMMENRYGMAKDKGINKGWAEQFGECGPVAEGKPTWTITRNLNEMDAKERDEWLKRWNSLKCNY